MAESYGVIRENKMKISPVFSKKIMFFLLNFKAIFQSVSIDQDGDVTERANVEEFSL